MAKKAMGPGNTCTLRRRVLLPLRRGNELTVALGEEWFGLLMEQGQQDFGGEYLAMCNWRLRKPSTIPKTVSNMWQEFQTA